MSLLAIKAGNDWILLHAFIVLLGPFQREISNPPVPKEFLYLEEERDISTLMDLINEIEMEGMITSGIHKVSVPREKDANWWSLPITKGTASYLSDSDQGRLLRYEGASLNSVVSGLEFDLNSILKQFHIRPYRNLLEFSKLIIGTSLDISRLVNVDIIAPTWTSIMDISLVENTIKVKFKFPKSLSNTINLNLTLESEGFPLRSYSVENVQTKSTQVQEKEGLIFCEVSRDTDIDISSGSVWIRATATISHQSDVLLASKESLIGFETHDENPNRIQRIHFERAVALADECEPEPGKNPDDVPKVGVVIVKDGTPISEAYRGQIGSGDHAEYIALEEKGVDKTEFVGADLITTLEPCTKRGHGKGKLPCTEWIIRRKIRKVWIGSLDLNYDIRGVGEVQLLEAKVAVGRIPDDLTKKVMEQNKRFFAKIQNKPRVPIDELQSIIRNFQTTIHNHFEQLFPVADEFYEAHRNEFFNKSFWTRLTRSKSKQKKAMKSWLNLKRAWFVVNILKDLHSELDMAEIDNASYWCRLGRLFVDAYIAYLIPFEKDLASGTIFTRAAFDTVYEDRERHEIGSETAYDRTGQPASDGSLQSWMKHRRFLLGPAWKAYSTAIRLDSQESEAWVGRAKVELFKRRFEQCYASLERATQIRMFDVSGRFVPAEELLGFDVEATYHWLARLIDIEYPTIAFPFISKELHHVQLGAVFHHIQILGNARLVHDLLYILLKRPLSFDSPDDIKIWKQLEATFRSMDLEELVNYCRNRLERHDQETAADNENKVTTKLKKQEALGEDSEATESLKDNGNEEKPTYIDMLFYPNLRRHIGWPYANKGFVGIGIGRILFQIPYDRLNDDEVWWHEFLECAIEEAIKHENNYKEKVVLGRGKIELAGETTVPHFVASLLTNSSMIFDNVLYHFEPDGFAELFFGPDD